jgi:hypothetical protein
MFKMLVHSTTAWTHVTDVILDQSTTCLMHSLYDDSAALANSVHTVDYTQCDSNTALQCAIHNLAAGMV